MYAITEGLTDAGHSVKVLFFNTHKHPFEISSLSADTLEKYSPESVYIDNRVKTLPAFFNLFTRKSYNITRFYSKAFEQKLAEILQKETFDLVLLETIVPAVYLPVIRKYSGAKVILRQHNFETLIWKRRAAEEKNPLKKKYLQLLSRRLESYELGVMEEVDAIAAISDTDLEFFRSAGGSKPIKTIPIGVKLPDYDSKPASAEFSLFFLGAMEWSANLDGLLWFLDDIWPVLNQAFPELQFHIAGRRTGDYAHLFKGNNIIIDGEVPSAGDYILSQGIMVVPLLYGSGTRVKIIEAMALGKPVISTDIGAEGIKATAGKEIMIAGNAARFIEQLGRCRTSPDYAASIGRAAAAFARRNFDRTQITQSLIDFIQG